jgi:hypothetical protein
MNLSIRPNDSSPKQHISLYFGIRSVHLKLFREFDLTLVGPHFIYVEIKLGFILSFVSRAAHRTQDRCMGKLQVCLCSILIYFYILYI